MTFRELMVLVRLYRSAPADLRRWADQRLPELREAAELTEEKAMVPQTITPWHDSTCPPLTVVATHRITGPVEDKTSPDCCWLSCECGWSWNGPSDVMLETRRKHLENR